MAYVYAGVSTAWEEMAESYGAQKAPYMAGTLGLKDPAKNRITCQSCGKTCTDARGGFVLTRSTIVCGKCYRPELFGEPSGVSNYGPTADPATCQHERRDAYVKREHAALWPPALTVYCVDCWSTLKNPLDPRVK